MSRRARSTTTRRTASLAGDASRSRSVSQKRITIHPSRTRPAVFRLSRFMLAEIFAVQYAPLAPVLSRRRRRRQSRPCQKSPSTKTATRARTNTISGLPDTLGWWTRKRRPNAVRARRRASSAFVSVRLIALAIRDAVLELGFSPSNRGALGAVTRRRWPMTARGIPCRCLDAQCTCRAAIETAAALACGAQARVPANGLAAGA